ncbi:NAD(P)H-hydrate epimerase [Halobacteriales archaeon Cl-PHB]
MIDDAFRTPASRPVPAVTAAEMREVDRVAVEEAGFGLLQMMENAGRGLATAVREHEPAQVLVVAGDGGNGGGGLAAARHLANRGTAVSLLLDRPADALSGAAASQFGVHQAMETPMVDSVGIADPDLVVDALVGYGLEGPLRGQAADLTQAVNAANCRVVSLDVPSGVDATSGERSGPAVDPDRVVTLALPKTGLVEEATPVTLVDIAIPDVVYDRADIPYRSPFEPDPVELRRRGEVTPRS